MVRIVEALSQETWTLKSTWSVEAVTYVICEPCIGVKDASCVEACPVDCIHSTDADQQYFIDPDVCIECGACEPVCPVSAIRQDSDVPDEWKQYTQINADFFKR
jgi:NAD-dependent dihydropyrimidine dehydrogenase PreA subunit